ncbi:hypothetical protein FS749_013342 [Ceratobasidium sp. UAMH 11750]|nr:hypothetical protein FS749_013342 [Ceratobasidium sp. UAMH 11750]
MNEGVGEDQALKAALVEEANLAFELSRNLFQTISIDVGPTNTSDHVSKPKIVFDASTDANTEEKTYPVSSVVAVVMALALAHFILVVGGFTGARGAEKLEAVMVWLRSTLEK